MHSSWQSLICVQKIRGIGQKSFQEALIDYHATISYVAPTQPLTHLAVFAITVRACASATILSSSMAEHSAVNRRVVGSSPTSGAIFRINKLDLPSYLKKYQKRAIVRDFVGDLNKYQSQS